MNVPWKNLGDLIDPKADPSKTALVDLRDPQAPREWRYDELDAWTGGVAAHLAAQGLKPGDNVAIASLNRAEYLFAYFGIMRAGYVAVHMNIKLPQATLDALVADGDIRYAFVDGPRRAGFEGKLPVLDFDEAGPAGFASVIRPQAFETVTPAPGALAQMLYTSGSTGLPKGVQLSHAGQAWALAVVVRAGHFADDRYLVAQPLFHMNGLFMAKRALSTHATLVILPAFDINRYVAALADYRINTLTAVPTMFARIIKDPALLAGRDFSAMTTCVLGSAPMTRALWDRIQQAFPKTVLIHTYGTTEAGPAVFGPHPDGIATPPLALGYPLPEGEVKLVGGANDDEGVLWMRNPAVMAGYRNLPAKSAQVLQDGWYNSGDLMRRDAQGFHYFVGRADDMFVCSGENIYPGEVELLLEKHPLIQQACVLPVPDEERSQVPVAFIVPKAGASLSVREVKDYALANGPAYQHPRRVAFVAELPWAGTHKIDRNALSKLALRYEAEGGWSE
ncbi:Long-chain-fatty-acid--CoA ligase [plant metagenome]|uniref:Long-chain-fatty-acid--CoA ligase n=1 Tax=plant metagenome TaxID=1297885 RepID=A0A484NRR9_9ZZZZ